MAKFTHEGVEIELIESSGKFVATVGGKKVVKGSLAAIKKAINKDKLDAFVPFTVLYWTKYDGEKIAGLKRYRRVKIIGKRPAGRGYRNPAQWITEGGREIGGGWNVCHKDCSEVIELLKADEKNRAEQKAAKDKFDKIEQTIENKLKKFKVPAE